MTNRALCPIIVDGIKQAPIDIRRTSREIQTMKKEPVHTLLTAKSPEYDVFTREPRCCATGAVMVLDPTNTFLNKTDGALIEIMGPLSIILTGGLGLGNEATFKERAEIGYAATAGGKVSWSKKATILEDGTYQYPDDPEHKPLAKFLMNDEVAYVYEGAFIAVPDSDGKWITARLD